MCGEATEKEYEEQRMQLPRFLPLVCQIHRRASLCSFCIQRSAWANEVRHIGDVHADLMHQHSTGTSYHEREYRLKIHLFKKYTYFPSIAADYLIVAVG